MYNNLLPILNQRYRVILLSGLVVAILSVAVSFIFPLEYRADTQVLLISKSRYGVDPYTVVKSAERVGENLVAIIKTNDFYNKVMLQPNFNLDKSKFENVTERTKRKNWQKAVESSVVYGTGVLNISAYNKEPKQAEQLAGAAANALVTQGWEYVGGDVAMKLINEPVATRFPVRPNLLVNAIVGFLAGIVLSGWLIIRKYQE